MYKNIILHYNNYLIARLRQYCIITFITILYGSRISMKLYRLKRTNSRLHDGFFFPRFHFTPALDAYYYNIIQAILCYILVRISMLPVYNNINDVKRVNRFDPTILLLLLHDEDAGRIYDVRQKINSIRLGRFAGLVMICFMCTWTSII